MLVRNSEGFLDQARARAYDLNCEPLRKHEVSQDQGWIECLKMLVDSLEQLIDPPCSLLGTHPRKTSPPLPCPEQHPLKAPQVRCRHIIHRNKLPKFLHIASP